MKAHTVLNRALFDRHPAESPLLFGKIFRGFARSLAAPYNEVDMLRHQLDKPPWSSSQRKLGSIVLLEDQHGSQLSLG